MSNRGRKNWLIADTHYLHDKVCKFSKRPDDFADQIRKNWQHLVQPQDTIIHLGDVIFGNKQQLTDILKDLPGQKILVRGNHDKSHSDTWFLDAGFSFVCQIIVINNIILSHRPAFLPLQEKHINIHGHFHNMPKKKWESALIDRLTENHYLLSIELVNYTPILLNEAISKQLVVQSKNIEW